MDESEDARTRLGRLSEKQREVLDFVLDRRTNKEIAHALGISVSGVEQRLQSARQHLSARTRAEAARIYEQLIMACGFTTGGKNQVQFEPLSDEVRSQDVIGEPVISLEDSSAYDWPSLRQRHLPTESVLEMLDDRFGVMGRVGVVVCLSTIIAIMLLTALSIADALDKLF